MGWLGVGYAGDGCSMPASMVPPSPQALRGAACDHAPHGEHPPRATPRHPSATPRLHAIAVPELKAYMQDLVPGVRVDPEERIALLRKGGVVRAPAAAPAPALAPAPTQAPSLAPARSASLAR